MNRTLIRSAVFTAVASFGLVAGLTVLPRAQGDEDRFKEHEGELGRDANWPGFAHARFEKDIDAALDGGHGKLYFFRGDQYLRFDVASNHVDEGYPKPIAEGWPGTRRGGFDKGIDAAINWRNGKAYFFRGANYLRYDLAADRVDEGYPQPIAGGNWPGLRRGGFDQGIDAAIYWTDGKVYFFRGADYVQYDAEADRVDEGFPKPIAGNWPGMERAGFDRNVRAALRLDNGKAYFFRDRHYIRYDIAADHVDEGYPALICP